MRACARKCVHTYAVTHLQAAKLVSKPTMFADLHQTSLMYTFCLLRSLPPHPSLPQMSLGHVKAAKWNECVQSAFSFHNGIGTSSHRRQTLTPETPSAEETHGGVLI